MKTTLAKDNDDESFVSKVYSCQRANYYTIKDGKIVKVNVNDESIEKDELNMHSVNKRLTEDEIRQDPKFKNYERGTPSKVINSKDNCY